MVRFGANKLAGRYCAFAMEELATVIERVAESRPPIDPTIPITRLYKANQITGSTTQVSRSKDSAISWRSE